MATSTIRPMTQLGMPKAFWQASPMELDCTIAAHEAERQDDRDREEARQELAEAALEGSA